MRLPGADTVLPLQRQRGSRPHVSPGRARRWLRGLCPVTRALLQLWVAGGWGASPLWLSASPGGAQTLGTQETNLTTERPGGHPCPCSSRGPVPGAQVGLVPVQKLPRRPSGKKAGVRPTLAWELIFRVSPKALWWGTAPILGPGWAPVRVLIHQETFFQQTEAKPGCSCSPRLPGRPAT